jgi:hypothetical protein
MCIYNLTIDYRGAISLLNALLAEGQSIYRFSNLISANSSAILIRIMHLMLLFDCRYFKQVWVV